MTGAGQSTSRRSPLGRSLKLRLVMAAALWALPILVLAALLLLWVFMKHEERQQDADLAAYQHELLSAANLDEDGMLHLDHIPSNPRFARPLSGWYWQAAQDGVVVRQSISAGPTGTGALPLLAAIEGSSEFDGPGGRRLRALVRRVTLPESASPLIIVVTAPREQIDADLRQFALHIALTFLAIGVTFLAAIYLQVGFGLRPLAELRHQIAEIRAARSDRLGDGFPREIEPVVDEVNALIDHNRHLIERARLEAGNLAHALKNPLSVLGHEIGSITGPQQDVLAGQVRAIRNQVERILGRIRAAGPSTALLTSTPVKRACDDIVFSLGIIYRERNLMFECRIAPDVSFAGDAGDFTEMIGNLADNACKWARARVAISAEEKEGRLRLRIDDDGPGIAPGKRQAVLARGLRLDERAPGSGLGLDIVREIAELYRGALSLQESPLGGLRAVLDLPSSASSG